MTREELAVLVSILLEKGWLTEELTCNSWFRACHKAGDYRPCLDLIAAEIRKFGGNTFTNIRCGEGPQYKEVALDVCRKLNVPVCADWRMRYIDQALLDKVLADMWHKMTQGERRELLKALNVKVSTDSDFGAEALAALLVTFRAGGFASYQLAVIVANAIAKVLLGQGLSLAANAALTKILSIVTGPLSIVLTTIWVVKDVAGPAYRVTIPVVLYIAAVRQRHRIARKKAKNVA